MPARSARPGPPRRAPPGPRAGGAGARAGQGGWRPAARDLLRATALWLAAACLLLPLCWRLRLRGLALPDDPVSRTALGLAGDPVNLALLAPRADLVAAFHAAGWAPADPVTWRSALGIGLSVAFDRACLGAPVSALLLDGRRQDLAFERCLGRSPGRRHHVRLWARRGHPADGPPDGPPLWLAAASLDRGVGFSRYTGQVTHHIARDLDAERDGLASDLARAGWVEATRLLPGLVPLGGRNGGGDPYATDGAVRAVVLRAP